MSQLANEYQSINLGQGFPDFNPDSKLLNLVAKAMTDGHNQYPYMPGVDALREVIANKVTALYQHTYDKDLEITITSGATEAIMASVLSVVRTGDEVIIIEPNYDCYVPAVRLAGGEPILVAMTPPASDQETFRIDWSQVANAITPRTRLIMLNSPHNPTGSVLTENDLVTLEHLVSGTDIMLLSDEVYEHITFTNEGHLSLATRPALAARTFVISSFGKTTHTTGWKVGYCCAPPDMTRELRKIHQFMVFTVPSPFQHALAAYTQEPDTYLSLAGFYKKKRDHLYDGLLSSRFKPYTCPGTYFLLADYSEISDMNEADFSIWLTKEHGVTVIPVSAFYRHPEAETSNHKLVRFCFAKTESTLDSALEKLASV